MASIDPGALAQRLPPGFLIGAATAAYQVEGSPQAGGKGQSIWDTFVRQPDTIERGETGDVACRSYERWVEDAALCGDLGLDAYRFSIAWTRIQPRDDRLNVVGLDHYDRFVDALLERGVQPVVTLYHWDLPQWVQDRAGWASRDTAQRFADYAATVGNRLGDRVHLWCTINEPFVVAYDGHLFGTLAPGIADGPIAARTHHHLLLAHGLATQALRALGVRGGVGIVNAERHIEPADDSDEARAAVERATAMWGAGFRNPLWGGDYPDELVSLYGSALPIEDGDADIIATPLDFVGVNNYTRELVVTDEKHRLGFRRVRGGAARTEMDWEIVPQALSGVLKMYAATWQGKLPALYVTENGMADALEPAQGRVHDDDRIQFLASYLSAVADAIDAGVDVRGYFVWSLLDNFEWACGYRPRFGVVHVDHQTGSRTVKDSGLWLKEVASAARRRTAEA